MNNVVLDNLISDLISGHLSINLIITYIVFNIILSKLIYYIRHFKKQNLENLKFFIDKYSALTEPNPDKTRFLTEQLFKQGFGKNLGFNEISFFKKLNNITPAFGAYLRVRYYFKIDEQGSVITLEKGIFLEKLRFYKYLSLIVFLLCIASFLAVTIPDFAAAKNHKPLFADLYFSFVFLFIPFISSERLATYYEAISFWKKIPDNVKSTPAIPMKSKYLRYMIYIKDLIVKSFKPLNNY